LKSANSTRRAVKPSNAPVEQLEDDLKVTDEKMLCNLVHEMILRVGKE
jgi:hypothetical protein